jgi:hypothetical protein
MSDRYVGKKFPEPEVWIDSWGKPEAVRHVGLPTDWTEAGAFGCCSDCAKRASGFCTDCKRAPAIIERNKRNYIDLSPSRIFPPNPRRSWWRFWKRQTEGATQ